MHMPMLAGVFMNPAHRTHGPKPDGQSPTPPFGSVVLHAYPWSGSAFVPETVNAQAVLHSEPVAPPSRAGGPTQQISPFGQSLPLVQATHTGPQQSVGVWAVHVLFCGQQTSGGVHAVIVQSRMLLVDPLVVPVVVPLVVPVVVPVVVPLLAPPDDEPLDPAPCIPEGTRSAPVRLPHATRATTAAGRQTRMRARAMRRVPTRLTAVSRPNKACSCGYCRLRRPLP
jgi:hypothetical protein